MGLKKTLATTFLASAALATSTIANAGAVITNGTVSLGVNSLGDLNFGGVGVKDNRTGFDGTISGCPCEGWGVANSGDGTTGYADESTGTAGLALDSFVSDASTATSTVHTTGGASSISVTQAYAPSANANLYQDTVTITNTGAAPISDLLYRRLMDWDIMPTAFSEYVTLQGWPASALLHTSDDGFQSANPLSSIGTGIAAPLNSNFTDTGPADHGALFDFSFGTVNPGDTITFSIFYGAALNEADALASLGAVGAEVYSLGESNDNRDGNTPGRSVFMFGFAGVGGTPIGAVPEPSTWAMMLAGFGAIGLALRTSRRKKGLTTQFA